MKKQFLTMMLMLVGMTAWAQEFDPNTGGFIFESGWTDPGNEYQQKTVVYLRLNSDDETLYGSGNYVPEVAAFIDGELRAITSKYTTSNSGIKIYTLRVGGTDADKGKEIKFKIFHDKQGIIYPLTDDNGSNITYQGDHTAVYPSEHYTMSFKPAARFCAVKDNVVYQEDRNPFKVSIRIGAAPYILDNLYDEVKVYDASGNEMTKGVDYEAEPFWWLEGRNWEYEDELGLTNHQGFDHVKVDGKDAIEGVEVTDMSWGGLLRLGRLSGVNLEIEVLERYYPVESIEITGSASSVYWMSTNELTFDSRELNGLTFYHNEYESNPERPDPTFPGVKFLSSSNTDVIKVVDGENLQVVGKGTATITVVDIDDENGKDVTATFELNVITALMSFQQTKTEIFYDKTTEGEEDITDYIYNTLDMSFQWEGESSYQDETYYINLESNDGDVIRFDNTGIGDAESWKAYVLKKGTVKVTYVSNYDENFQISYDLIVTQAPTAVDITSVGDKSVTEPIIVAVGEELTATAVVTPADADLSEFTFQIVDEYEQTYIDIVEQEMCEWNQETNECTLTFKFTEPTTEDRKLYLMAVAKGTMVEGELVEKSAKMEIQASQGVTRIEVTINNSEDLNGKSYPQWYDGPSCEGNIDIKVYPENATDKSVTVMGIDGMLESDESYRYGVSKGTYTVTIVSNENPNATATFDLVAKLKVSEIRATGFGPTDGELYNDGRSAEVTVEYLPADADFDIEKLSYVIYVDIDGANSFDEIADGWKFFDVERTGFENSIVSYQFTPRSLCYRGDVTFEYDTSEQEGDEIAAPLTAETQEFSIGEKVSLNEGWNWVSFISAKNYDVNDLYNAMYDQEEKVDGRSFLTEVRSQNSLVIVDPEWGLFGELEKLQNTESYKINLKAAQDLYFKDGEGLNADGSIESKDIAHGWNWISFPYEYAYGVEEILGTSNFRDEDVLLSKDGGFATFTEGEWVGSLTTMEPNQGYLLYSNVGDYEEFSLQMPNRYELTQGTFEAAPSNARDMNRSVWNYDGSRFANVMPIIGELIVPAGADVADYTIGAFVGDECRGEGRIVKGRAFITVAGEAGEEVSFRAYNEWTGEYCEIENVVTFGSMLGSLKAPTQLVTRSETTSVEQAFATLTIQGDVILAPAAIQVYDAQGKIVAEGFQRVSISHLGQGVYVVKAGNETQKIAK